MKKESTETGRPNREAIRAYKESLGANSGKSKADNTESSEDGPDDEEDDEEDLEFDVLDDIEGGWDREVDEEGAEASGKESNREIDEDELPTKVSIDLLNTSFYFLWYRVTRSRRNHLSFRFLHLTH